MNEKSLIVDFANIMHRSYHVVPPQHRAASPPGGLYILYRTLNRLFREYPCPVIFALEGGKPTRKKLNEAYKSNRKPMEDYDEFKKQWRLAEKMLRDSGATLWRIEGCEADDLIGAWAKNNDCYIFSNDKDLDGLVRDESVKIIRTDRKGNLVEFSESDFKDKYEFNTKHFLMAKALLGDTSDNIKGIKGWGPKNIIRAIKNYNGDIEIMRKKGFGKVYDNLRQNWDVFQTNLEIFALQSDIVVDVSPTKMDMQIAKDFMTNLGMKEQ